MLDKAEIMKDERENLRNRATFKNKNSVKIGNK
jgi:hypothetical protein